MTAGTADAKPSFLSREIVRTVWW